jgi:hypothetical protein
MMFIPIQTEGRGNDCCHDSDDDVNEDPHHHKSISSS